MIWALVGLYRHEVGSVSTVLVRIDTSDGTAKTTVVDPSVPGDTTRRLAPADHGVVLLEGEGRSIRLVGFEQL